MAVVIDRHPKLKPPTRSQRCRLLSFTNLDFSTFEPSPADVAHSLGHADLSRSFHRSLSTSCLTLTTKVEEDFSESSKVELIGGKSASKVRALVVEVAVALASGVTPVPISNGLGGAYFLHNRTGDPIAVAKPMDEEPLALNNPKGYTGRLLGQPGLKRSVRIGETGIRELAAYLLDHGGFSGVPPTALVKFSHVKFHVNDSSPISSSRYKIASLQRFAENESDAGDLSPSRFSTSSVHRIGILDIRLLNIDRHSGNILVGKYDRNRRHSDLTPIDHGLCLPEWLDDPYFEWIHWPQSSIPFSDTEMEYISGLNPFEDARILRTQLPRLSESSIRVLMVCTLFLKRAASSGFCLGEIGEMMTRGGEGCCMSMLEAVCARAKYEVTNLIVYEFDGVQGQNQLITKKPPLGPQPQPNLVKQHQQVMSSSSNVVKLVDFETIVSHKVRNFVKSVSFSTPGRKNETEGISFRDMNQREWELFFEVFERVMPVVLKERKSTSTSATQRVGLA